VITISFIIGLFAAVAGAISGIGGGILIKPALDATHALSVAEINILSGSTVLVMVVVSLWRSRKDTARINIKMSSMLGLGAAMGGFAGKQLLDLLLQRLVHENIVGAIQSILLLAITVGIFFYLRHREKLPTKKIQTIIPAILIGLILGMISAFLGIGGGPMNIAFLYYFFSMEGKEVVRNSLFIVLISQFASLTATFIQDRVPDFSPFILLALIVGCICGALIGSALCCRMNDKQVERFFSFLLLFVAMINIYNFVRFVM
jgi:uncharacterized protein